MINSFEISAPGKVILHGEHSVVYGKPAIAGPIGLRTYLTFEYLEQPIIVLSFKSIPFESFLTLEAFNQFLEEYDCINQLQPLDFLGQLRNSEKFIFSQFVSTQPSKDSVKETFSLGTSLYMINRVLRSEGISSISFGFHLTIKSSMSIGAGLGSSAGYGVCVSAGALIISKIVKQSLTTENVQNFSLQNDIEALDKISKWAFDSEIVMHERPSGIDNTICTFGNLIVFKRGEPFNSITLRQQVNILIVDTKVSRTTSKLVAKVADLKNHHPKLVESILDAMGYLVEDVVSILEDKRNRSDELQTLVSINNNLLRSIGVSHPSLERIFQLAEGAGFNAKLTGAGGGGCALIFMPENYRSSANFAQLTSSLNEAGFQWLETTIGGQGVDFRSIG